MSCVSLCFVELQLTLDRRKCPVYDALMDEQTALQRVREAKQLSRARLAGLAEITSQAVYDLERGQRCPRLDTARRIANAMGVTVDEIFPATERVA